MSSVLVSSKGQVVIPASIRRQLNITPGSVVNVEAVNNKIEISVRQARTATTHASGFGMLRYTGVPKKLADFDVAKALKDARQSSKK